MVLTWIMYLQHNQLLIRTNEILFFSLILNIDKWRFNYQNFSNTVITRILYYVLYLLYSIFVLLAIHKIDQPNHYLTSAKQLCVSDQLQRFQPEELTNDKQYAKIYYT